MVNPHQPTKTLIELFIYGVVSGYNWAKRQDKQQDKQQP